MKRLKSALKKTSKNVVTKKPRDELINPIWASDKGLGSGLTIRVSLSVTDSCYFNLLSHTVAATACSIHVVFF